jgi:NADPH2:quinone reductase
VRNQARIDPDRIVRMVTAKCRALVDDERAHGRAVARRRECDDLDAGRLLDPADAPQRVAHDLDLERGLYGRRDVLPCAAAAARGDEATRRRDACRRRIEHFDRPGAQVIRPITRDLDLHALAGKRALDEHDPPIVGTRKGISARDDAVCSQFHPDSQLRETAFLMKAQRVHELGEPERVLTLEDVPVPEPARGEVRLRVHAASLNFPDVLMCRGEYQVKPPVPFTPGAEVAGAVDALGTEVDGFAVGDRVLAIPSFGNGGFTEYTTAAASGGVFAIPESMSFASASALHVVYQTGHLALHRRAALQPGETLLVHAGAGGVGSAAIQLGRAAGAAVIATAGGPEKVEVCRKLGADLAIDYRAHDFVDAVKEFTDGRGADVIYDPVGGDTFDRSTKCIAFEGRILVIGFTGGRFADARTNHVLIKNYSVVGVHWGMYNVVNPALVRRNHEELMRLFEEGKIDPLVSERVDLAGVPSALARLGGRGTFGKVVCEL